MANLKAKIFLASRAQVLLKQIFDEFGMDKTNVKCLFITTASEEQKKLEYLEADKKAWKEFGVNFELYTITGKSKEELKDKLSNVDMVYVAGGNTFHLLAEAKKSGFIELVKEFVAKGGAYVGTSAGTIIASTDISYVNTPDEEKLRDKLPDMKGIGFIDAEFYVHIGNKMRAYHKIQMFLNGYFREAKQILLTDNQGILVNDGWIKYLQA